MNSYEQLLDRFDTFRKEWMGSVQLRVFIRTRFFQPVRMKFLRCRRMEKEQEHSQDKEIAAKLQEIIIAIKIWNCA